MKEIVKREAGQEIEPVVDRPYVLPRCDIFENKDEVLLRADLPGVSDKGLQINLDEDRLMIEARPDEVSLTGELRREFDLVDYRRSFLVPEGIDRDKIAADLTAGVLTLKLPKSEKLKPRRIEVKGG